MTAINFDYIKENIEKINANISTFDNKQQIKVFLSERFHEEIANSTLQNLLVDEIKRAEYVKAKITAIANKYFFYKADLEQFYYTEFFRIVAKRIKDLDVENQILDILQNDAGIDPKLFSFIKTRFKKIINKTLYLAGREGFLKNILHIESGVYAANAGDSAQFLFLGRAILAGYNCSNVDVRSSRYDAIIDYHNTLLRVQIKGVSTGSTIPLYDRARGGLGIDYTHERNQQKRVTSKDCDILVAVDKETGICFILPMKKYVDKLSDDEARHVTFEDAENYKENWEIIHDVANANEAPSYLIAAEPTTNYRVKGDEE